MYNWFNKHLKLGHPEPVVEKPFVPVPPAELAVFDAKHSRPKDAVGVQPLRDYLTRSSDQQLAALYPKDAAKLAQARSVLGIALSAMIGGGLPANVGVRHGPAIEKQGDLQLHRAVIGRKGEGDAVPALGIVPAGHDGTVTIWIHPRGRASLFENGKLVPAAKTIVDRKSAILAIDCLRTGEQSEPMSVDKRYAGFTFAYNRPLVAERVRDILTAVAFAKNMIKAKAVHLVGHEQAGPWVVLARALAGDAVARTAADMNQFRFENILSSQDEMMLPGALKYGGMPALSALCAPGELYVHNDAGNADWLQTAYRTAGAADRLRHSDKKASAVDIATWLMR
jgi:hypothetical protein